MYDSSIPCKDCLVLGICKGIVNDGKERLNIYKDIVEHVDVHMGLPNKFKLLLTQQSILSIIEMLALRCSLLGDYLLLTNEELPDENYWNVRKFYNINQGGEE